MGEIKIDNVAKLYDIKVEDCELLARVRVRLSRAGYNTIGDFLSVLEMNGLSWVRENVSVSKLDLVQILRFLKKNGYSCEEYIETYIQELETSGDVDDLEDKAEHIEYWKNVKEHLGCVDLRSVIGAFVRGFDTVYVEEFLERYQSEHLFPDSVRIHKWRIIKKLDEHGYRLKSCPKDKWEHIEEYIQFCRAADILIEDLHLPKEIEYTLVSVGITASKLISENFEFLQSYFSNREISILLHHLDENNLRMKNIPVWEHPDITEFISQNIEIPIADIGLPKRIVNKLLAHSIENVGTLIRYSRQQLIEEKIVSVSSLNEIAQTLLLNKVHLVGDKVCECSRCKTSFAAPQDFETNICLACQERAKRIENARKRNTVVLENPIYYTYEGSFKLAVYATIHNNTEKEFEIKLLDFVVYCANRQWTSTTFIEGYRWENEVIMPMSAKTIAKTWTHPMWEDRRLQNGDYVTFAIEINGSTNSYKFVIRDGSFVLDDYHLLEFKKKS